jgi:hypothetical protein
VNSQRIAELQVVLEGIRLPATRRQLIEYAARYDASFTSALELLPDREYDRIDAVGEELLAVQPALPSHTPLPKPESGEPPGGADYVAPTQEPGSGSEPRSRVSAATGPP